MAACLNRVTLVGFVGASANISATGGGTVTASFSLATSSRFKDKAGDWKDRTEWHNLVAFGRRAEIIRDYVHKGSYLLAEGELRTRTWKDDQEVKRYRTEIILSDVKLLDRSPSNTTHANADDGQAASVAESDLVDEFSDSIPF